MTTEEKLDAILVQNERILEQQEEIIELLLENGIKGSGYSLHNPVDSDYE